MIIVKQEKEPKRNFLFFIHSCVFPLAKILEPVSFDIDKYLLICKHFHLNDNKIKSRKRNVMISYEPLWKTMQERNVTTYTLIYKHNFSPYTITNLKRNKSITMNTLEKLCRILNCTADNIVEFIDDGC